MLDVSFFNNLVSVTKFVLKATPEGPLGLVGSPHRVPLKLKKEQMPNVKTVCLEYIFICPELIDFLAGHQKTLESLSLHRCSASRKSMARNGIPWKDLFDCLYSSGFNKFRHLEVRFDRAPYRDQSWDLGGFRDDEDGREDKRNMEAAKQVRHLYRQNQHRITFPYTWLSTRTGLCLEDSVENLRAFERGQDQASYDKLMHKLKTNANNYGSSQGKKHVLLKPFSSILKHGHARDPRSHTHTQFYSAQPLATTFTLSSFPLFFTSLKLASGTGSLSATAIVPFGTTQELSLPRSSSPSLPSLNPPALNRHFSVFAPRFRILCSTKRASATGSRNSTT